VVEEVFVDEVELFIPTVTVVVLLVVWLKLDVFDSFVSRSTVVVLLVVWLKLDVFDSFVSRSIASVMLSAKDALVVFVYPSAVGSSVVEGERHPGGRPLAWPHPATCREVRAMFAAEAPCPFDAEVICSLPIEKPAAEGRMPELEYVLFASFTVSS